MLPLRRRLVGRERNGPSRMEVGFCASRAGSERERVDGFRGRSNTSPEEAVAKAFGSPAFGGGGESLIATKRMRSPWLALRHGGVTKRSAGPFQD